MKSLLKIVLVCLLSRYCFAQSVTILPNGITPALAGNIPSLSYDAIMALPSPGIGSLATDLTFKCLRFYDGSTWAKVLTNKDSSPVAATAWAEIGSNVERGYDIKVDVNGNIYLAGIFYQELTIGNQSISSTGETDIFLAKYNKNGTFLWLKKAGGSGYDYIEEMEVDASGNIYMTGYFYGTTNFNNLSLTSVGVSDIFLVKYNTDGEIVWVQKAGGSDHEKGKNLFLGTNGDIYVTGDYNKTTSFNNNASVTSKGGTDVFIAKYNNNGVLQWVKSAGGTNDDNAESLVIDNSDNVYLIGTFNGTISFGNISVASSGNTDMFIAKYNPLNTTWTWVKCGGGPGYDYGRDITITPSEKLLITGNFENTATFESNTLTSAGGQDIYIAEYSTGGYNNWAKREGGKNNESVIKIGLDTQDNIYISGGFYGLTNFGSTFLNSDGTSNIYIAKLNANGICQWVQKLGGSSLDVNGMDVKGNGSIYITGGFNGEFKCGISSFLNTGGTDIFIARVKE